MSLVKDCAGRLGLLFMSLNSLCARSSLLGRRRLGSNGPFLSVFILFITFSPALLIGLLGSVL